LVDIFTISKPKIVFMKVDEIFYLLREQVRK